MMQSTEPLTHWMQDVEWPEGFWGESVWGKVELSLRMFQPISLKAQGFTKRHTPEELRRITAARYAKWAKQPDKHQRRMETQRARRKAKADSRREATERANSEAQERVSDSGRAAQVPGGPVAGRRKKKA